MSLNVNFFNPDALITISGWTRQSSSNGGSKQRAQALDENGDELAYREHGNQKSVTMNFVATATTGNLTLPKIGAILNGYHVDNFTLTYSQASFPTLSVSAHKHGNAAHDECRTYTPSITAPACFGVPSEFGEFDCGDDVGMRSLSYSCQVNHVDENDGAGEHLAGDNYDGSETVSIDTTGITTITAPSGWTNDSSSESKSNTAAETASASFSHHIQHDVAAAGTGT